MLLALLLGVDLSTLWMRAVVDPLDKARLGYTVLVQDLALLPLVEMLGEEDRILAANAPLLTGVGIDGACIVAEELIRNLLKLARVVLLAVFVLDALLALERRAPLPTSYSDHLILWPQVLGDLQHRLLDVLANGDCGDPHDLCDILLLHVEDDVVKDRFLLPLTQTLQTLLKVKEVDSQSLMGHVVYTVLRAIRLEHRVVTNDLS